MTPTESATRIQTLEGKLAAMTEERDFLQRELTIVRDEERVERVTSKLCLTRTEGKLLMALYARQGRCVTQGFLMDYLYGDRPGKDEPEQKIITVLVCKIRKKIGKEPEMIATHWGRGFTLTPAGVELVEKAATVTH